MNQQRRYRVIAWIGGLALIALPILSALQGWFVAERWPIRQLSLHAEFQQVSAEELRRAILPTVNKGFFAIDLKQVQTQLQTLPWIERAEVRKAWPDRLDVTVYERRAVAIWREQRLLSANAELFTVTAARLPDNLPRLSGPDGSQQRVFAFHLAAVEALRSNGLQPFATELSARGAWTLSLTQGASVVLGNRDVDQRLHQFSKVFRELPSDQQSRLLRADLRYANGFALRWSDPLPSAPAPPLPLTAPESAAPITTPARVTATEANPV